MKDEETADGIALKFAEQFQNHYPKKPLVSMMEELRKDIENYAALKSKEAHNKAIDNVVSLLTNTKEMMKVFQPLKQ